MASHYTTMKVHILDNQTAKSQQAFEKCEAVSIQLLYEDLPGNDLLAFTMSQTKKTTEAHNNGVSSKMSNTHVEHIK